MRALLIVSLLLGSCAAPGDPITEPVPMPGVSPFAYPLPLWDSGVAGETLLMLHITEHGRVDSVRVVMSSGQPAFDSAAVAGAPKLNFVPGRRGDRPLAMWTRVPVRFQLDSLRFGN